MCCRGNDAKQELSLDALFFFPPAFHEDPPYSATDWLVLIAFVGKVGYRMRLGKKITLPGPSVFVPSGPPPC